MTFGPTPRLSHTSVLGALLVAVAMAAAAGGCAQPTSSAPSGCPVGLASCGGKCVDKSTDVGNCGACGTTCVSGQQCQSGACGCLAGLTACGSSCVSLPSDAAHCGSCATSCTATQVCDRGTCSGSCSTGLTACSGGCVALNGNDPLNCGACGKSCPAGQSCSAGACGCPVVGQMSCNNNCVDVMTSAANCGSCGKTCAATQVCAGGTCGCPSGQMACPNGACALPGQCGGGTGGAGGAAGATGTGGTAGATGAGGAGGTAPAPTPQALSCGGVNIAAADVISDFRQTTPIMYQTGTRGGTTWYAFGAEDVGTTRGPSTPGVGTNVFAVDAASPGPCNSGGSLKISSNGNEGSTGWGIGFGVNLMQDVGTTMKKGSYNAMSAGYTGIGFWAKCSTETDFVYVKTVDGPNDGDIPTPTCVYSGAGTICNQFGIKNETMLTAWTYHRVYFADALQDWDGGTISTGNVSTAALTAFQLQMNTKYTRDGSARVRNPFTCWIDDVHFLKDTPPSANANVTPKACTTNAANSAPGGYYTTGNQILDCKTGQTKVFRGIARPSLEWDRAGWDITYEDLGRIQAWGANAIRFSLNQAFWQDPAKGGLYQRTVQRAVKWSLSLGMDVILDLHWTGSGTDYGQKNMPIPTGIDFWTSVANTAAYKNDGRVIFELYNEPFGVDAATWKNGNGQWAGMQQMYNAVRNTAGAKNLILVGGLDYAYHLDQVLPAQALSPAVNVAYVTHPYQFKAADATAWNGAFGNLAATYPVVATEFGQANISQAGGTQSCSRPFYDSIISYFKGKGMSWTAWAWHVERGITDPTQTCGFPQVVVGYGGATNPAGDSVKAALSMP